MRKFIFLVSAIALALLSQQAFAGGNHSHASTPHLSSGKHFSSAVIV